MTTEHPHDHRPRQAGADTLLLDIGGDIGALSIVTDADRDELEVEISPVGADPAPRTHNVVRARRVGANTIYAAVFPSVPAGEYTVWRNDSTPAGTVVVRGGAVSDYRLGTA
jgi:hypothetical protein